ncbi:type II secretion system F family protein [Lacticaseibacillus daqingensis]|uniref:type II secretion system F family protein n=1 Tax=Lacticaseibacillus daqingensis TaxID=2486014 RepID=UPI0013DDC75F|nr:type II secretion system F family protein [Lacticaseibacillus daqingensis]
MKKLPKLKLADQLVACERLITLLSVGFSLADGLTYLRVSQPRAAPRWRQMRQTLARGGSVAAALQQAGFDPVIVTQAQLATVHGQLADGLTVAVRFLRLQQTSRHRLMQLLVYPAVLMTLLLVLQGVLILGVIPMLGATPPGVVWLPLVGLGLGGGVGLLALVGWRRCTPLQRGRLLLAWPGVRQLARLYYQAVLVSGVAQFLAAGQPVTAYLAQLAALPPAVLPVLAQSVLGQVAAGQSLEVALRHPLVYPPARELMTLGQPPALVQTGMALLAQTLLATLQARLERWLAVVQPLLFLVIGAQIVLMYQALLGPLYGQGGIG